MLESHGIVIDRNPGITFKSTHFYQSQSLESVGDF